MLWFKLNKEYATNSELASCEISPFFLGGAFGSWIGSYTYYKFNSEVTLLIVLFFIKWTIKAIKGKAAPMSKVTSLLNL